jgi:hypothetical protein
MTVVQRLVELARWYHDTQGLPWGLAIHNACQGEPSLKAEVGRVLGIRGAVQREINRRKATRVAPKGGQQEFVGFLD